MKIHVKSQLQKDYAIEVVSKLGFDEIYTVSIVRYTENRRLAQNNLLHMWLTHISQAFAESGGGFFNVDAWKTEFKKLFLGYTSIETPSGIVSELRHTADLNTKEFAGFLTLVDHYVGSELGILDLPRPSDYQWIVGGKRGKS